MSVIDSKQFSSTIVQTIVLSGCVASIFWLSPAGVAQDAAELRPKPPSKNLRADDRPPVPKGMVVKFVGEEKKLLASDSLGDWAEIDFAGGRESGVKAGVLTIRAGEMLSGVYWDGVDPPKNNYELSLEARRTGGIDFFCGAAIPVNDSHCCLIVGGWAGATVGLSNIDDLDASSNATTKIMLFEDNQWYKIRIRVLPDRIIAWIEDECVIYQNITGKKISLRGDTELLTPLGLCTFATTAEMRNITLSRILPQADLIGEMSNTKKAKPQSKTVVK